MLSDITIGQMYPSNSLVHKLDPRFKLVFTFIFVIALFVSKTFIGIAVNAAFVILCYILAKIPFSMFIKTVKPVLPIVIFMMLFNVLFYGGQTVLFKVWVFKLTLEGIETAIFMVFRIILIISGTAILTYTTSSIELTDALESLLSPLKVLKFPVHELAMMMTIALRFIPTLIEETEKIISAQKSRGADFESGNLLKRAKALMPILIPLFISAINRAGDLATAMESRCYHNGIGRTRLKKLKSSSRDYVALSVMILFFVGNLFI